MKRSLANTSLWLAASGILWSARVMIQSAQPAFEHTSAATLLNPTLDQAAHQRLIQSTHHVPDVIALVAFLVLTGFWLHSLRFEIRTLLSRFRQRHLALILVTATLASCVKPYDRPEHVEIQPNETAFLIPLEEDSKDQAKFNSEAYLEQHKVAAKRIQIPHRWNQTGRSLGDGAWIPSHRLIKVDRAPVTREWTATSTTGTSRKNEAIWIESRDSVGFTMGFSVTAFVPEKEAARFLYMSPNGSITTVLDSEARARIQQVAGEVAAQYDLDQLRSKKTEMITAVREDLTSFFKERGVTITTVAMFGGMVYENPEIQKAIDATVMAQQQKVVAQADFEAQQKKNETIQLEAKARAEAERTRAESASQSEALKMTTQAEAKAKSAILEAESESKAKLARAQAEAEGIRAINTALSEGKSAATILSLKELENQHAYIDRWGGTFPATYINGSGAAGDSHPAHLLLQLPAMPGSATTVTPVTTAAK